MIMSSLTFDPVSVPLKREREQRLRICEITTVKGKRKKNARTNNLKQEEKIILRFLLFNRRLLALNAVTAVNFANSQHGAAFCSSVDSLHCWRFLRNNDHTSATKYYKVKGSMRGKKWIFLLFVAGIQLKFLVENIYLSDNTFIPLNEKFRMFPWRRG